MRELLLILREQHQQILKLLDQPDRALELIHFVEKEHHPLEEEKLFPFLHTQKCLHQGGPRCSFYMGMRLDFNPLTQVRKHLDRLFQKTNFRPPAYPALHWLMPDNPLSIPYEEHIVGAELAQSLIYLLSPEGGSLHEEFFLLLYDDYCRLLRMHIDKEDNCLFVLTENTLV